MKKWFIKMAGDKPRKRSPSAGTQPVAKWNRRRWGGGVADAGEGGVEEFITHYISVIRGNKFFGGIA